MDSTDLIQQNLERLSTRDLKDWLIREAFWKLYCQPQEDSEAWGTFWGQLYCSRFDKPEKLSYLQIGMTVIRLIEPFRTQVFDHE
jgi:hypothetical protein